VSENIRPDVIHAHDLDSLFIGWMLKSADPTALVLTMHRAPIPWRNHRYRENPKDCFLEGFHRLGILDGIVVPSRASERVLNDQFGGTPTRTKVRVIPHGINLSGLTSPQDDQAVVAELRLRPESMLVICPSRADEHKDTETFLEAAGKLRRSNPAIPFLFQIGSGEGDPNHEKLKIRGENLGFHLDGDLFLKTFLFNGSSIRI
jgi:glycosyltransferase involved in cell wall biosynthesis